MKKVNVPILGMVQNMSTFTCTNCGHEHDIFGLDGNPHNVNTMQTLQTNLTHIGARRKCDEIGIRLLGDIPLHPRVCTDADAGKPTAVADPNGPQAEAFKNIADEVIAIMGSS